MKNVSISYVNNKHIKLTIRTKHVSFKRVSLPRLNLPDPQPIPLLQNTGSDQEAAMSQDATTKAINEATSWKVIEI